MHDSNPLDDPNADPFAIAADAAAKIAEITGVERHDIALTLGSGWGRAAELIGETTHTIPATEVPGFSKPALEGHVGTLRSVLLPSGKHALVIGARTHYYEGHGVRRVVHSVRTAAAAGATTMILTNGAGGIKHHWTPGTPVLISDHINLTGDSPLGSRTERSVPTWPSSAGLEKPGISVAAIVWVVSPMSSAARPQPLPSVSATSWRGTPVSSAIFAAASAATSNGSAVGTSSGFASCIPPL